MARRMNPFDMVGAFGPVSARLYESCVASGLAPLYDRFVAEATGELAPTGTVVDVGCGEGQVARRLAELHPGARVVGVDSSPVMVRRAVVQHGHLQNLELRLGEAASLPLEDRSAELVVSVASIKHWPDRLAGLAEALRVLVPAGRLVVLECDRDCSAAAARRFASYWKPRTPATSVVAGEYFRRFVAGGSLSLDELVELLHRAGATQVEARRMADLPFVAARARAGRSASPPPP